MMKIAAHLLVVLALAGYGVLQVRAYQGDGAAGFVASRAWIFVGLVALAASVRLLVTTIRADLAARNVLAASVFALLFTVALWRIGSLDWAPHSEGMNEIAAVFAPPTLARPDLGWAGWSHFQQPHRTFWLAAIPTVVMGPSVAAASLGALLPVLLGLSLLYAALRAWDADIPGFRFLALMPVLMLPTCPLVVRSTLRGDAIATALGLALLVAAWFLVCVRDHRPTHLLALAFVTALAGAFYAPALPVWVLCLLLGCGMVGRALRAREYATASAWACALLLPLLDGLTCLWFRPDLGGPAGHSNLAVVTNLGALAQNAMSAARSVLFFEGVVPSGVFMSGLVVVPVLLYLAASMLLRNGVAHAVVAVWVVLEIAVGTSFSGYSQYLPPIALYRVMAVIPVALAGMVLSLIPLLRATQWRPTAALCVVPAFVCIVWSWDAYSQADRFLRGAVLPVGALRHFARTVESVQRHFNPQAPFVIAAFLEGDPNYWVNRDALEYLFPRYQRATDPQQCLAGVDTSLPAIITVARDTPLCADFLTAYAGRQIERTELDSLVGPLVQYVMRAT